MLIITLLLSVQRNVLRVEFCNWSFLIITDF